jgi:hypothetical protein
MESQGVRKWKGGFKTRPMTSRTRDDLGYEITDDLVHLHYRSSIILLAFPSLLTIVLGCNMDTGTFMPITC